MSFNFVFIKIKKVYSFLNFSVCLWISMYVFSNCNDNGFINFFDLNSCKVNIISSVKNY